MTRVASCDRWREALSDVGAGAPPPPGFERHLAECGSCRDAFETERRFVRQIDAELQAALTVSPSPEFLPQARRRAEEQASPRGRWLLQWLVPVAVGVVMLVLGIQVGRRDGVAPAPRVAAVQTPSPSSPLEEPTFAVPVPEVTPMPRRAAPAPEVRPVEPEVLFPPGEEQLFLRFARDMQERRVDRLSLLAAGLDPGEVQGIDIPVVEVKPLVIEPISRSEP